MTTMTRIEDERKRFEIADYPTFIVEHEGEQFTCFVLPSSFCPQLPSFTYQSVSDDRTGITCPDHASVFGISESVGEQFRRFTITRSILIHWKGMTGSEATEREVKMVGTSDLTELEKTEYFRMRRDFLRVALPHARAQGYSQWKVYEIQSSLTILETVCQS